MGLRSKYDILRDRAKQQAKAGEDESVGALQRRFAQLGNLQSGAAIKQEQLAREASQGQAQRAVEDIDFQEQAANEQKQQIADERAFQSGEAEKGRSFAAGESKLGREFAAGESRLGRDFSSGEAGKQRDFQGTQAQADRDARKNEFYESLSRTDLQLGIATEENEYNKAAALLSGYLSSVDAGNTDAFRKFYGGLMGEGGGEADIPGGSINLYGDTRSLTPTETAQYNAALGRAGNRALVELQGLKSEAERNAFKRRLAKSGGYGG